jgi:hypothetical protein
MDSVNPETIERGDEISFYYFNAAFNKVRTQGKVIYSGVVEIGDQQRSFFQVESMPRLIILSHQVTAVQKETSHAL